jgi:hypothetical protein
MNLYVSPVVNVDITEQCELFNWTLEELNQFYMAMDLTAN